MIKFKRLFFLNAIVILPGKKEVFIFKMKLGKIILYVFGSGFVYICCFWIWFSQKLIKTIFIAVEEVFKKFFFLLIIVYTLSFYLCASTLYSLCILYSPYICALFNTAQTLDSQDTRRPRQTDKAREFTLSTPDAVQILSKSISINIYIVHKSTPLQSSHHDA